MFRFRGFKATFNISTNKKSNVVHFDDSPGVSLVGAYRTNKDELFGTNNFEIPSKKITPSMVSLPVNQLTRKDISKSTSNLAQTQNEYNDIRQSAPNIPQIIPKPLTRTQIKEQKKFEQQRLDEQKKQAKLAAKEQEKEENLRKEREKQMQKKKAEKKESKRKAPQPRAQEQAMPEIVTRSERQQPSNTLESSISRSSGPPPYTAQGDIINNKNDKTGNTSFADDSTSWGMISQHREQISRPQVVRSTQKQTHLDLNYNTGGATTNTMNNSDA